MYFVLLIFTQARLSENILISKYLRFTVNNFFWGWGISYILCVLPLYSYGLETTFTIVKEVAAIAGISPLDKDTMADFFSSPHDCPFTRTRDHHGNHPVVAASLSDFVKSMEQMISVGGVKWRGLEEQLLPTTAESAASVLQGGHQERRHWSYATITSSDAPAQVNSIYIEYRLHN